MPRENRARLPRFGLAIIPLALLFGLGLAPSIAEATTFLEPFMLGGRQAGEGAPALATTDPGYSVAVWQNGGGGDPIDGTPSGTVGAARPSGSAWTAAQALGISGSTLGACCQGWKVGVDRAGTSTAVVVTEPGSLLSRIAYARRPLGGQWTASTSPVAAAGFIGDLQLGVDPNGYATIVYSKLVSCGLGCTPTVAIVSQTRAPGVTGAWSAPFVLSDQHSPSSPNLAVGPNGTAAVVWTEGVDGGGLENGRPYVVARTRANISDSSWTPSQKLSCSVPPCAQFGDSPQVAISPNPAATSVNATAVWHEELETFGSAREGEQVLVASSSTAGHAGVFGARTVLDTGTETANPGAQPFALPAYPHVAMDAAGDATAIWESQKATWVVFPGGATGYQVTSVQLRYAQRSASGWSPIGSLSSASWAPAGVPDLKLAMNGHGDAAAAWVNQSNEQLTAATKPAAAAAWDSPRFIAGIGTDNMGSDGLSLTIDGAGAPTLGWADAKGVFTTRPASGTAPTAAFTVSPNARAGVPVQLASMSTAAQGSIAGVQWDLPDSSSTFEGSTFIIVPDGSFDDGSGATTSWTPPPFGAARDYRVEVRVVDSSGNWSTHDEVIHVLPPSISVSPASLHAGTVGNDYSQALGASGANPGDAFTFAVTAGALPAGVSLNPVQGVLGGTPTTTGHSSFTITATDADSPYFGASGSRSYALDVNPAVSLGPAALPDGTVGTAYSNTLGAGGGSGTGYTFMTTAGVLPAGLSLDAASGVLSGTPTAAGPTAFTITVSDGNGGSGARAYTPTFAEPTITVGPAALPDGTAGSFYSRAFSATGGTAPYTFATSAGAAPAGLSLDLSSGTLSGSPATSGSSSFTVTATDAHGATGSQAYTMTVAPAAAVTVRVSPTTLPGGGVGTAYNETLSGSGGAGPYTFQTIQGALPVGLALNSNTGVLSGTPTVTGGSSFTVIAVDSGGFFGSRVYAITVSAAPGNGSPSGASPGGGSPGGGSPGGGSPGGGSPGSIPSNTLPSNQFTLGGPTRSGPGGSAILTVSVPGPGALDAAGKGVLSSRRLLVTASAKKRRSKPVTVVHAHVNVTQAGLVRLVLKPSAAAAKLLKKKGSLTIMVTITFTPTGGTPRSESRRITFKMKASHRAR